MSSSLPPVPAQVAIATGFLIGTWTLVAGFHRLITGHWLGLWGHPGPWAAWGGLAILLGALWMLLGNLYLFRNDSPTWWAMLVLILGSAWLAGWAALVLAAQLVLLLLPATRRGLRA